MRVLLKNDATRITAATIVTLPAHGTSGRVFETLAGEPYPAEASSMTPPTASWRRRSHPPSASGEPRA